MFINEILNNNNKQSNNDNDYYRLLGCDPSSTTEQIIAEYRNRALQLHPDKATNEQDRLEREQKFCQLLHAKDILIDANKRKQYDRWLNSGLAISFEKFSSLSNHCHTSIHWLNNNYHNQQTKAITNSTTIADNNNESKSNMIYNPDPIESFRFNHSSSSFNDNDKILKMFRNYQI